jgi:hypothetical protein
MIKPISPVGINQASPGGPGTPVRHPRIKQIRYASTPNNIGAALDLSRASMGTMAGHITNKVAPGFAQIVLDGGPAIRNTPSLDAKLARSRISWGAEGNVFAHAKWKEFVNSGENGTANASAPDKQVEARKMADVNRGRFLLNLANRKSDS